jgi:ribose 1,5-bisphosphokinase PhnN
MTDIDEKLKAGAKAVVNKAEDAYQDLRTEYRKQRIKENLD